MTLPPGLAHVISQTRLFSDGQTYVILRLSPEVCKQAEQSLAYLEHPFYALLRDKDETTLVLTRECWELLKSRLSVLDESPDYRLITLDLTLDLGLVGYLAMISGELAQAGISIFTVSTFSRDHIFVMADDFDHAWQVLQDLIHTCRGQEVLS